MSKRLREAALVAAAYLACLVGATWPWPQNIAQQLPALSGAVLHDLANFEHRFQDRTIKADSTPASNDRPPGGLSPSQPLAWLVYSAGRILGGSPVLAFNLTWWTSVLGIGLGTYFLARRVHGNAACAALAGGMVMLSGPIRLRGAGHLDVLGLGVLSLAILAWLRWMEKPTTARLSTACCGVVGVACTALIHVSTFGAILILGFLAEIARRVRQRDLIPAVAIARGFGWLLISATLAISTWGLHRDEIQALSGSVAPAGTRGEYEFWAAPLWSYFLPAAGSRLAPLLEFEPFQAAGIEGKVHEASSYLGVVTLVFLVRAVLWPPGMERGRIWWFAFALLLALSIGACLGLRDHLPPLRWSRLPARFHLGVVLVSALIASASIRDWLRGHDSMTRRLVALVGLACLVLADGSGFLLSPAELPREPTLRASVFAPANATIGPPRRILEIPLADGPDDVLAGLQSYWNLDRADVPFASSTVLPRSAFDRQFGWNCPVRVERVRDLEFPRAGSFETFDLVRNADFDAYIWLYLRVHGISRLLATESVEGLDSPRFDLTRLRSKLANAILHEDKRGFVVDTARLPTPATPVVMTTTGWLDRQAMPGGGGRRVASKAALAAFDPEPTGRVRLAIEAASFRHARTVRAIVDGRAVATWTVAARESRLYLSPPFQLPAGVQTITLASEGEESPRTRPGDSTERFSLVVMALTLQRAESDGRVASSAAMEPIR